MLVSDEYIYPIVNLDDTIILMMHQKSIDELEVLAFNTTTNTSQKLLSSLYFPAHIKLLPNKKAYSFLDRGRIHIKEFLKRTPRALDIYQPICDIQSIQWINDHQMIFSARFKNHYKIFMYDIRDSQQQLYSLCSLTDDINYIFPCAIDQENLFCLSQHDGTELYQITQIKIKPVAWDIAVHQNFKESDLQIISLDHKKPFCFLKMIDNQIGYVIELAQHNLKDKMFKFTVHKIFLKESKLEQLFEFFLPEQFIIGMSKERLYESLYPLLPNYNEHEIYFTSFDKESEKLRIYVYELDTKLIYLYPTHKNLQHKHLFAPLLVHNKVHFGQSN